MRINNGKSPAARNNSTWKTLRNATAVFACLLGLHLMCACVCVHADICECLCILVPSCIIFVVSKFAQISHTPVGLCVQYVCFRAKQFGK